MGRGSCQSLSGRKPSRRFRTTQWGLVAAAAAQEPSAESRAALATLCELYWSPLYAYLRAHRYGAQDAEDLTQAFFARLLESKTLKNADPLQGRFRSYLLGALKHFVASEAQRASMIKRGGGRRPLPLNAAEAENRLRPTLLHERSPERLFEREWGLTILNLALADLRCRYLREGNEKLFGHLQPLLASEESAVRYRQIATELTMTEGAVKVAVYRLRRRYRELVRRQIARTVSTPEEIDDEIRQLFHALRG